MMHTRKTQSTLATLALLGLAIPQVAQAQTNLFSDNFNSVDGSDINAGINDTGRQHGSLTPGTYDATSGNTVQSATPGVDSILNGTLSMTAGATPGSNNNSVATIDQQFTLSANTLTISADLINPFAGNGGSWQAFIFSPNIKSGVFVNSTSQTLGLLFAPNGTFQAFSNGSLIGGGSNTTVATNFYTGGTGVNATGNYHIDISIEQLASSNTFGAMVNGMPLFTPYSRTTDIISSGYLELIGRTKAAGQTFTFDNLSVTAAPEPSQSAVLGLGLLGLSILVLKARKRSFLTA